MKILFWNNYNNNSIEKCKKIIHFFLNNTNKKYLPTVVTLGDGRGGPKAGLVGAMVGLGRGELEGNIGGAVEPAGEGVSAPRAVGTPVEGEVSEIAHRYVCAEFFVKFIFLLSIIINNFSQY